MTATEKILQVCSERMIPGDECRIIADEFESEYRDAGEWLIGEIRQKVPGDWNIRYDQETNAYIIYSEDPLSVAKEPSQIVRLLRHIFPRKMWTRND